MDSLVRGGPKVGSGVASSASSAASSANGTREDQGILTSSSQGNGVGQSEKPPAQQSARNDQEKTHILIPMSGGVLLRKNMSTKEVVADKPIADTKVANAHGNGQGSGAGHIKKSKIKRDLFIDLVGPTDRIFEFYEEWSVLIKAIYGKDLRKIKNILEYEASKEDSQSKSKRIVCAEILAKSKNGINALFLAVIINNTEAFNMLYQYLDDQQRRAFANSEIKGLSPMIFAALNGNLALFNLLSNYSINRIATYKLTNGNGMTVFSYFIQKSPDDDLLKKYDSRVKINITAISIIKAYKHKRIDMISLLIAYSRKHDYGDIIPETLKIACQYGRIMPEMLVDLVEFLLDRVEKNLLYKTLCEPYEYQDSLLLIAKRTGCSAVINKCLMALNETERRKAMIEVLQIPAAMREYSNNPVVLQYLKIIIRDSGISLMEQSTKNPKLHETDSEASEKQMLCSLDTATSEGGSARSKGKEFII